MWPLGNIIIDIEVIEKLAENEEFEVMSKQVDETEHSLEMHLPFIFKVMEGQEFMLVPILVGSLSSKSAKKFGAILSPYLEDLNNLFIISSDFCHWGKRFSYTYYDKNFSTISKSIEALDRKGMEIIESKSSIGFEKYLKEFQNTICGRHPISLLLNSIEQSSKQYELSFVQYSQSNQAKNQDDSSVSYASAVCYLK